MTTLDRANIFREKFGRNYRFQDKNTNCALIA